MKWLQRLGQRIRVRQRAFDMQYLWPAIRDEADSPRVAVLAFGLHVLRDKAWTTDYCREALIFMLCNLEGSIAVVVTSHPLKDALEAEAR